MSLIQFRPFEIDDLPACLNLFISNLDGFFSPDEVNDFKHFLTSLTAADRYYVGMLEQQIVACGGWDRQTKGIYLRWGIVDHRYHGQGLGAQLLRFRINKVRSIYGDIDLFIKTSDKAHGFFKKFGFRVNQVIKDGISPGIDEYQMQLPSNG